MSKVHDLTGRRFGRLTVMQRATENTKHGRARWTCKCDCGNIITTSGNCLLKGHTKSCGCAVHDNKPLYKHGLSKTRLHYIWRAMKDRCYNPKNSHYKSYGERGISLCDDWNNDFVSFYMWAINSGYREGLSIDRIDNEKGYSPDNCKWSTDIEQANNKRKNKFITFNGKSKTLAQWCREFGLNYHSVQSRLNNGWSIEKAFTTPRLREPRNEFHGAP